jgi:hypothetical protein
MEGGVLLSDGFKEFAKDKILFVSVTSDVPGRKYDTLLDAYGFQGFPTLALLSPGGANLLSPEGRSTKSFQTAYDKAVERLKDDKKKIKKAEKSFEASLKKAAEAAEEARKRADAFKKLLETTKAKAKKGDKQATADIEIYDALQTIGESRSRNEYIQNRAVCYVLFLAGKKPTFEFSKYDYYINVFDVSISEEDAKTGRAAFAGLKKAAEGLMKVDPSLTQMRVDKFLGQLEQKLNKISEEDDD